MRDIIPVIRKNLPLPLVHFSDVTCFYKPVHDIRHPADDHIKLQIFHHLFMHGPRHRLPAHKEPLDGFNCAFVHALCP